MQLEENMNYLVFDRNIFNSLRAGGIQNVYYCSKDSSVFHITSEDILAYINWEDFSDVSLSKKIFLKKDLTILYSRCPVEICGLYESVSFFYHRSNSIYISRPHFLNEKRDIISFSDCPPEEIIYTMVVDRVNISDEQKKSIYNEWNAIRKKQSNLRIWHNNRVENVDDAYFDDVIRSVLQMARQNTKIDITMNVQLLLRKKYHIGINPKYIEWRVSDVLI